MLTDEEIELSAKEFNLEYAAIKAVLTVETNGSPFLKSGKLKILFEGHIFWKELIKLGINPAKFVKGNENILYQKWTKSFYKGGEAEYDRLEQAKKINEDAALKSTSWGAFQIMGNNYKLAGYDSVQSFVENMKSESEQLKAFLNFIKNNNIISFLQKKDWAGFACKYNGLGYKANQYDKKLQKAYGKI